MYARRTIPISLIWHFCKWHVATYAAWSLLIFALYEFFGLKSIAIPFLPIATIGTAVAFYVGFKNNSSYERLWEARKIWGSITNASRSFAIGIINLLRRQPEENGSATGLRREIIYRHLAWINMLRIELRQYNPWTDKKATDLPQVVYLKKLDFPVEQQCEQQEILQRFIADSERAALKGKGKITNQLLNTQLKELTRLKDDGLLDTFEHSNLMLLLVNCFDMQGAAERINSFPFPRQYAYFSSVFVTIFTTLLPFGLIGEFDKMNHGMTWLTVPFSVLISWMFITMEQVGDTSENPFEMGLNDVPMTAICRSIEIDLRCLLNESDLPDPIAPVANVLV